MMRSSPRAYEKRTDIKKYINYKWKEEKKKYILQNRKSKKRKEWERAQINKKILKKTYKKCKKQIKNIYLYINEEYLFVYKNLL